MTFYYKFLRLFIVIAIDSARLSILSITLSLLQKVVQLDIPKYVYNAVLSIIDSPLSYVKFMQA